MKVQKCHWLATPIFLKGTLTDTVVAKPEFPPLDTPLNQSIHARSSQNTSLSLILKLPFHLLVGLTSGFKSRSSELWPRAVLW